MKDRNVYLLMLLCILFWSGAFIAAKFSVSEFPPFTLTFLRFSIASIVISQILPIMEKNWKIKWKDVPILIFLGSTGMFGYHLLFFIAVKHTTVIHSSLIGTMNPIITTILAMIFLKDKISIKKIGAILLSFVGVIFTVTEGNFVELFSTGIQLGDFFMFCAVLCWAFYSIVSKKVSPNYPPIVITAYSFFFCTLLLVPFVIFEKGWNFIPRASSKAWAAVLYMALLPSVVGFLIQQVAIKNIGPRRTSMFGFLVPIVSIFLSVMVLNEIFRPVVLISSFLIIAGIYFATQS